MSLIINLRRDEKQAAQAYQSEKDVERINGFKRGIGCQMALSPSWRVMGTF